MCVWWWWWGTRCFQAVFRMFVRGPHWSSQPTKLVVQYKGLRVQCCLGSEYMDTGYRRALGSAGLLPTLTAGVTSVWSRTCLWGLPCTLQNLSWYRHGLLSLCPVAWELSAFPVLSNVLLSGSSTVYFLLLNSISLVSEFLAVAKRL